MLLLVPLAAVGAATAGYPLMPLFKLPQTTGAACLDGTPPAYWFLEGAEKSKYYVNFEGGGWCTSLDDCYGRAYTSRRKGSSNGLPDPFNLEQLQDAWGNWYYSNQSRYNPLMHNWSKVEVLYCDGASWTGMNDTITVHKGKPLHFQGKRNLDALMAELLTKHGMSSATEVVISGGSAGALAVYLHADAIRAVLPFAAKVVALPDDGFFMDNDYSEKSGWAAKQRWVYQQQNSSAGVPADCLAHYGNRHPSEDWKCLFAQYTAPLIKTPLFALQPKYDAYQTGAELKSTDPKLVNAYGQNLTATLEAAVLGQPGSSINRNGAFLDACWHHGGGWPGLVSDSGEWPGGAFSIWYAGLGQPGAGTPPAPLAQRYWKNSASFPCRACCPCKPNRTSGNFNQACRH